MSTALVLVALAGALAAQEAPTRRSSVFVLDFKTEAGLESVGGAVAERVAEALARHELLDVMTREDVVRMLELEAEKQLLSCDVASGSCLAELAGALGADLLAFGSVARIGDVLVANVTLYDARSNMAVGRRSVSGADAQELRRALPSAVHEIATPVGGPVISFAGSSPLFIGGTIALAVGAATAIVLGGVAIMSDGVLGDETALTAQKESAQVTGVAAAIGAGAAGAIAVGGAVGMGWAFASEEQ